MQGLVSWLSILRPFQMPVFVSRLLHTKVYYSSLALRIYPTAGFNVCRPLATCQLQAFFMCGFEISRRMRASCQLSKSYTRRERICSYTTSASVKGNEVEKPWLTVAINEVDSPCKASGFSPGLLLKAAPYTSRDRLLVCVQTRKLSQWTNSVRVE